MALDSSEFFRVNGVEEPHHELTLPGRCGCHIFGILTSAGHYVVKQWGDGSMVDGGGSGEDFPANKLAGVEEFGSGVFGSCDEKCLFAVELDSVDLVVVRIDDVYTITVTDNVAVLEWVQHEPAVGSANHNTTVERHPHAAHCLGNIHDLDWLHLL